jgi:hypothetical protein
MNQPLALDAASSRALLLAMWATACIVLIYVAWPAIVSLSFRDQDDALRLVQVRDLLGGQSWFDLTQHRIFPPHGTSIHWSRLVDLPIALLLGSLETLLGAPLAERITLVAVPLGLLLVLSILVYKLSRWMEQGHGTALLAVFMLLSSLSILVQFSPMRIDHHGMQIVFGALATLAIIRTDRRDGRLGLMAAAATACWLQISVEGLPFAVVVGLIFGLRHISRTDRWADLRAYMLALPIIATLLLFGTRYPTDALLPWCDSFSPSYLVPLGVTSLVLIVGQRWLPCNSRSARMLPLAIAGAAGVVTFLALSRQCLAGPFETLDPLVYKLWYRAVLEGLPFSAQPTDIRVMIIMPSLLGLLGSALTLRRARHDRARAAWISLLVIQVAAFALSLCVMRAMSFAHLVALPGNAALLAGLMTAAQRLNFMPLRVGLTAATVLVTPFGAASATAAAFDKQPSTEKTDPIDHPCATSKTLRGLDALPATILFTPLDVGAHLLVYTHHEVVATGHHRNVAGMKAVLHGLTASPQAARSIVTATRARYLAFCKGENDVEKYRKLYPRSLIAMLAAGVHPDWLQPVAMRPGEAIKVYRIVNSANSSGS